MGTRPRRKKKGESKVQTMYGKWTKSIQIAVIIVALSVFVSADGVNVVFPTSGGGGNVNVSCAYDTTTEVDRSMIWAEQAGTVDNSFGGEVFGWGDGDSQLYGVQFGEAVNITRISLYCQTFTSTMPTLQSNVTVGISINRTATGSDCKVSAWSNSGANHQFNETSCNLPIKSQDYVNFDAIEVNGPSIGGCLVSAIVSRQIHTSTCNVTVQNQYFQNITNITYTNVTNITIINQSVSNETILTVVEIADRYLKNNESDTGTGNYTFTGFVRSDGASLESGILAGGYYVPLDGDITSSILGAYYILHKALDRHTITSTGLKNTGRGFNLGQSNFVQLDGTTQNPSLNITLDLNTFTTPFIYGPYTFLLTFKSGQILPDSITLQGVRQSDGSIYTIFTDSSPTYLSGPSSDPSQGKYYVRASTLVYSNRITGVNLLLSYTGTVNNNAAFDEYFLYMPYAAEMTYSLIQQGGPLNMNFDGGNDFNATFHNIRVDGCVIYNGGTLGTCV